MTQDVIYPGECLLWLLVLLFSILNNFPFIPAFLSVFHEITLDFHCRLSGVNNRNLFYHSFRSWKSEIRGPAWVSSGESSLPGLQTATFSLYPYMGERKRPNSLVSHLIRALIPS